ncbi:regulator of G-protein signaling 22-like, partial [Lingula anatina]|uniref:Regulator of G-protein signaling 22-like n=1 Tax=Lingula anatina TaxID=7574 RepID=A0A1S3GZA2_LINAN
MPQITVKIEPPEVEEEDLEDLLATDGLFIEYFNTFLSLPTFPEPLCFNKNTGGFEIVTDAKKELAKQIKAAVRSAKRTPKIYRVTKNHSFSDIPLIPIEEDTEPEKREINTSFTVKTFPEPLCFNKNTGGFEIVTDAKKELAKQIKAAVRSAKRTPKIYRVTKNHSFSDIPLIPIEEDTEPEKREINTSFTVK